MYGGAAPKYGVGWRTSKSYATATRMTIHEPTNALTSAEETTETNDATTGPPADPTRPRGNEIAPEMTVTRRPVTRIAPKSDHRWPFVICQLRESPPTALSFSIMI